MTHLVTHLLIYLLDKGLNSRIRVFIYPVQLLYILLKNPLRIFLNQATHLLLLPLLLLYYANNSYSPVIFTIYIDILIIIIIAVRVKLRKSLREGIIIE